MTAEFEQRASLKPAIVEQVVAEDPRHEDTKISDDEYNDFVSQEIAVCDLLPENSAQGKK